MLAGGTEDNGEEGAVAVVMVVVDVFRDALPLMLHAAMLLLLLMIFLLRLVLLQPFVFDGSMGIQGGGDGALVGVEVLPI